MSRVKRATVDPNSESTVAGMTRRHQTETSIQQLHGDWGLVMSAASTAATSSGMASTAAGEAATTATGVTPTATTKSAARGASASVAPADSAAHGRAAPAMAAAY